MAVIEFRAFSEFPQFFSACTIPAHTTTQCVQRLA